jgi:beta-N-acetylhexosaminidase
MTNPLSVLMPGFVGTTLPAWLEQSLRDGLGAVCLFAQNVESREQLRELTAAIYAANPAAIIAIDEEGGEVTRLYQATGSPFPGNAILGRIDDADYTRSVGEQVGQMLRDVGVTLDFAPDADINSNPANPVIGVRSFGDSAALVAAHTAAWVQGLQSTGVAASVKHFPGHGDTAADSHLALPIVDLPLENLRQRELAPFAAAIAAGTRTVMTSHILLPQLDRDNPATFSSVILDDLLRGELGFTGVIVSDALDMVGASGEIGIPAAANRAIAAGCDLLCIGTENTAEQLTAIAAAIERAPRLAEAAGRVRELATSLPRDPLPPRVAHLEQSGGANTVPDGQLGEKGAGEKGASEPVFDLDRTIGAFAVRDGVRVERERTLVAVDAVANIAVGPSPWGPPSAIHIAQGDELPAITGQLVIIGRDNQRRPWLRELIDSARREHPSAIVVDMGWPDAREPYSDVVTFGASTHIGLALERWLERETQ